MYIRVHEQENVRMTKDEIYSEKVKNIYWYLHGLEK